MTIADYYKSPIGILIHHTNLADKIGMNRAQLHGYLKGKRNPNKSNLIKLENGLRLLAYELLDLSLEPNVNVPPKKPKRNANPSDNGPNKSRPK
jgi:transcriptional regulator with XRE-family HTH domain